MQKTLSRRKVAEYVASHIKDGVIPDLVIQELAAYIIDSGSQRELTLIVRSIYDALERRGVVVAEAVSAHELTTETRNALKNIIGADKVFLREEVRPDIIGGVRLSTPSATLDTTVAHKLTLLKGAKL